MVQAAVRLYGRELHHKGVKTKKEKTMGIIERMEKTQEQGQVLADMVCEVYFLDGGLEEYYYYDFDEEFFNNFYIDRPMEACRAMFFGNVKSWNDEYIRINDLGNLESMSDWEYGELLVDNTNEIIEKFTKCDGIDDKLKKSLLDSWAEVA